MDRVPAISAAEFEHTPGGEQALTEPCDKAFVGPVDQERARAGTVFGAVREERAPPAAAAVLEQGIELARVVGHAPTLAAAGRPQDSYVLLRALGATLAHLEGVA